MLQNPFSIGASELSVRADIHVEQPRGVPQAGGGGPLAAEHTEISPEVRRLLMHHLEVKVILTGTE